MKHTKVFFVTVTMATGFLMSACTSSQPSHGNAYIYNGINFGYERNIDFKQGVIDACRTADGQYTKDRELFNNNISYKTGWEDGRIQCKGK